MMRDEGTAVRMPDDASESGEGWEDALDEWYRGSYEPMGQDEESALFSAARSGDALARDTLIRRNMRLVISMASSFRKNQIADEMDHVQNGLTGMMQAMEKFDPEVGTRFSTYAVPWIRQAIMRGLSEAHTGVTMPPTVYLEYRRMTAAIATYSDKTGQEPRMPEDIAPYMAGGKPPSPNVWDMRGVSYVRLDFPSWDEEGADDIGSRLEAPASSGPDEAATGAEARSELLRMFREVLAPEEYDALTVTFGFGDRYASVDELAEEAGIKPSQIRRLRERAMMKLLRSRHAMDIKELLGYDGLIAGNGRSPEAANMREKNTRRGKR